jgi:hypothetical protein
MFFHVFLSHLYFLIAIVQNANMASRWSRQGPGPWPAISTGWVHSRTQSPSYARSTERDEGLWPNPFWNNRFFKKNFWITGCVIMAYLVEFHGITKILLKSEKSEKSRNITKSN